MNTKTIARIATLVGAAAVLSGCQHGGGNATGRSGGGSKTLVAFVTNNASDYWAICRKGADKAQAELPNVDVQFIEPDGSVASQKSAVNDLLVKGVKGIAISPDDPANETPYLNDVATKTSLITSDSDAPASNRLCYLGTDNHAAGLMAGQLIKEAIPKGGKIMLFVGNRDAQNAQDREKGIRDALKDSPQYVILDVRTDQTDRTLAKSNASTTMIKYPDLACMVGLWSYNGPAICSAVEDANKVGKVKIVAFDQEQPTIDGIKKGAIYGTVVQQPYEFGYQAVKLLAQLASGDKSGIPASKQIYIPTQVIKQDNLSAYQADQAKLMGGGS